MLARALHRSRPMSPFRTLRAAARASRRSVIVAVDDWLLSRWLGHALRATGATPILVDDAAALFDALAEPRLALVIADRFDGAPCENLLATIRTAGCRTPALIVAPIMRPAYARLRLAPVSVIDPLDGAALATAVRRAPAWRHELAALVDPIGRAS
jgi:hypothetical protein